ncbi:MAG: alpha/beta fold hydrolase [Parcubacteria group bacterium]
MKRKIWVVSVLLILILFFSYGGISVFSASEVTKAERRPLDDTPARLEISFEEVEFPARGGNIQLRGWWLPATTTEVAGTIILVHGLDDNRATLKLGLVDLADGLRQENFNVLMFDLRGHGESDSGRLSGGLFEQDDLLGAYDWVVKEKNPPCKIGLLGISMGASISLLVAAREPGISGVVADSPFANIKDMLATEIPKRAPVPSWLASALVPGITWTVRTLYKIDLDKIDPEKVVGDLKYPFLLIHCDNDERIPVKHSRRLHEAAPSILWVIDSGEHAQIFKAHPEDYIKRVSDYFRSVFKLKSVSFKRVYSRLL